MSMFDRLEDTLRRYEDVTAELGNPDIVNDQEKFRKYMKEQSNLAPIVEAYTEYKASKYYFFLKTLMMIRISLLKSEQVQVEKKQRFLPQSFSVCTHTMQILRDGR